PQFSLVTVFVSPGSIFVTLLDSQPPRGPRPSVSILRRSSTIGLSRLSMSTRGGVTFTPGTSIVTPCAIATIVPLARTANAKAYGLPHLCVSMFCHRQRGARHCVPAHPQADTHEGQRDHTMLGGDRAWSTAALRRLTQPTMSSRSGPNSCR